MGFAMSGDVVKERSHHAELTHNSPNAHSPAHSGQGPGLPQYRAPRSRTEGPSPRNFLSFEVQLVSMYFLFFFGYCLYDRLLVEKVTLKHESVFCTFFTISTLKKKLKLVSQCQVTWLKKGHTM